MTDDDEFIDEEPMTIREIEHALAPYLTRADRRRLINGLKGAGLIVFRDEPPAP